MTIGERIRAARERSSITQSMLAKKMNVTPQNISQYERNLKNPKPTTIKKIAIALNVPMSYLLGFTNDPSDRSKTHWMELLGDTDYENCYKPDNLKEQKMIKKYRTLDEHGKKITDLVLDAEYERVLAQQNNEKSVETEETKTFTDFGVSLAARDGKPVTKGVAEEMQRGITAFEKSLETDPIKD